MANGYINNVVKSVSYTGTTNTLGFIFGGLNTFGIYDGKQIISAYIERGDYNMFRSAELGCYGNAGFYFLCTQDNLKNPIVSQEVTLTIYYI